jgi:hypothetical protein
VAASAEAIPVARKKEPARTVHMRRFHRNGSRIFTPLAKSVRYPPPSQDQAASSCLNTNC